MSSNHLTFFLAVPFILVKEMRKTTPKNCFSKHFPEAKKTIQETSGSIRKCHSKFSW